MYQALYYCHQTYTYYLRDDKTGWTQFKYQPTYWKRVDEWDEGAQPILTGGWAKPTKKFSKDDPNLLEKDINKELLVLRELYYKFDDVVPSFHNIVYLDIEIEMGGALTSEYIKAAPMPLTYIALIDMTTKTKICFIVDKSKEIQETNQDGKLIIPCGSEKELIKRFLDKFEELDPTIIIGWNSAYFDIPYLYFRLKQIVGDEILRMSPIRKVDFREFAGSLQVKIGGVNHLDYMLLHKKYIMKEEPSYKLGDIGTKYVGLGKIEYEGNLNTLFKTDINKFIDYNLRDVEIIEALEDKLKFIELTVMISHICNIPYESIYYNTVMNEGAVLKYLKREGIISPNKPTTHNPTLKTLQESYMGGYLLDIKPGLYNWLSDYDYSSFYPACIRGLNIGIETLIGRITIDEPTQNSWMSFEELKEMDPNEIIEIEKLDKEKYIIKKSRIKIKTLIEFIEENNYTISANGVIYNNDEKSIFSLILENWFGKRKQFKKEMYEAFKNKNEQLGNLLDLKQHAFKILLNAFYGGLAINSFRYTDGYKIMSSSVTCSCQRMIQETIKYANELIDNEYLC